MQNFAKVIYSRYNDPEDENKGKIVASKFQSELSVKGKKVRVGVYRLMSVVDVAGMPEPKKSDTEAPAKKKSKKAVK